jgi:hypothetical protein
MCCGDIFLALIAILFPPIAGTSLLRCLDHHVANIPLQQYGSKSASAPPTPSSISPSAASATSPASSTPGTSSPATLTQWANTSPSATPSAPTVESHITTSDTSSRDSMAPMRRVISLWLLAGLHPRRPLRRLQVRARLGRQVASIPRRLRRTQRPLGAITRFRLKIKCFFYCGLVSWTCRTPNEIT